MGLSISGCKSIKLPLCLFEPLLGQWMLYQDHDFEHPTTQYMYSMVHSSCYIQGCNCIPPLARDKMSLDRLTVYNLNRYRGLAQGVRNDGFSIRRLVHNCRCNKRWEQSGWSLRRPKSGNRSCVLSLRWWWELRFVLEESHFSRSRGSYFCEWPEGGPKIASPLSGLGVPEAHISIYLQDFSTILAMSLSGSACSIQSANAVHSDTVEIF